MKQDIRKQYNNFAQDFSQNQNISEHSNNQNRADFYKYFNSIPSDTNTNLLDLCCGDGYDADQFFMKGFNVRGIDASEELIKIAKNKYPHISFDLGFAESLPYDNESFDIVSSKYALMTSQDMKLSFNEVHRVLKQEGFFIYLVTHPIRQYFEKRNINSNYFEQEIVESNILNNTVTLHEPTHTFNEYFNADFFSKFEMIDFKESFDPAAEQVDGRIYPGYFIVVCKKK